MSNKKINVRNCENLFDVKVHKYGWLSALHQTTSYICYPASCVGCFGSDL